MPSPIEDLKSQFDKARSNGGGIVECLPNAVYDFALPNNGRVEIDYPPNTFVRGNGSVWKGARIAAGQGTANAMLTSKGTDIDIRDVTVVGDCHYTIQDKSGQYFLDVVSGGHIRMENCRVSNMLGPFRCRSLDPEPIPHVVLRDLRVENCYYGPAFSTPGAHVRIENLYCKNVIRGFVLIGCQDVRVQAVIEHDGLRPRLETLGLCKSQSTPERAYETDGIVVDITAIGTVGLRRLVQIEFQGPPNMKPSHIRDVDFTGRFIGPGWCPFVGFASFIDGTPIIEQAVIGKHELSRVVVRGTRQSLAHKTVDPQCRWKPLFNDLTTVGWTVK